MCSLNMAFFLLFFLFVSFIVFAFVSLTVLLVQACLEVIVTCVLSSDDTYLGMCLYMCLYR